MEAHLPILKINIEDLISKNNYPLVYIPDSIVNFLKANKHFNPSNLQVEERYKHFLPKKPLEPSKPDVKPIPIFIEEDVVIKRIDVYDLIMTFLGYSLIVWVAYLVLSIIFILFGKILSNPSSNFTYSENLKIFILMIPFLIALLLTINYSKNSIYSKILKKKRHINQSEIDQIINQNILNEHKYKREYVAYNEKYEIYKYEYISFVEKYSVEYLLDNYRNLLKSSPPQRTSSFVKKSSSENYFLEYLLRYFGDSILINTAIEAHNSAFYPDFVYESKKYNYFIDIEIDEKYDSDTKMPIHYVGCDDIRNNFFLEKNWFIIRFTESQIQTHPDECCIFIKEFISKIDNPHISIDAKRPSVSLIRRWTYEEAYLDGLKDNRY